MNMCKHVASPFYRLCADRRGITAIAFALGAAGLFGLVGLATEGGTWYLEKRHGQNAADAAAISGALALASNSSGTAAVQSATSIAATNSYTTSTATNTNVTINYGSYNGGTFTANSASPNAVQAVMTRSLPRLFSGLFLASNVTISETAVAVISPNGGNACMLAGPGGLNFAGSTQINVSNCTLASNRTGSNSISFTGNKATVSGGTLVAEGGCSNCGNSPGYLMYQPATIDPYTSIQSITMPPVTASQGTCQNMPTLTGAVNLNSSYTYGGSGKMLCSTTVGNGKKNSITFTGDLSLSSGNSLNLTPGTYIFYDASITVNGGATLTCSTCTPGGAGVTIILTGDPGKIGTLSIDGGANVTLNAPAINSYNSAFNGVLFYMDKNAVPTNGSGNAPVKLGGNGNVQLTGGMYFPSVNVTYSGNVSSANSAQACTEIIGYALDITGNSTLNISGCAADGTNVARTKSVQLVQ